MDNSRLGSTTISPLISGLCDHDAQFLTIMYMQQQKKSFYNREQEQLIE